MACVPLHPVQAQVSAARVSAAEKALAGSQKQGADLGARLALAETDARLKVGSIRVQEYERPMDSGMHTINHLHRGSQLAIFFS
jgi:hypothetical protein